MLCLNSNNYNQIKGKTVQNRRGPAAVTGDRTRRRRYLTTNGKAREVGWSGSQKTFSDRASQTLRGERVEDFTFLFSPPKVGIFFTSFFICETSGSCPLYFYAHYFFSCYFWFAHAAILLVTSCCFRSYFWREIQYFRSLVFEFQTGNAIFSTDPGLRPGCVCRRGLFSTGQGSFWVLIFRLEVQYLGA